MATDIISLEELNNRITIVENNLKQTEAKIEELLKQLKDIK